MRTSFLLVILGTMLSFVTNLSIGRVAVDALGVGIVLVGCVGVIVSLIAAARADDPVPAPEAIVTAAD